MPFIPPTPSTNGAKSPEDGIPPDSVFSPHTAGWAQNQNGLPSTATQRPPMSPITPTLSNPQLQRTDENGQRIVPPLFNTNFQEESVEHKYLSEPPPPVLISESEEPDVIALRAASSILQRQREKAEQDIRQLEEIRRLAMEDPVGWIQSLLERQNLNPAEQQIFDLLAPTILNDVRNPIDLAIPPEPPAIENAAEEESDEGVHMDEIQEPNESAITSQVSDQKFPSLPAPQNIFRTPAINWDKYQVSGESLEHLHHAQLRRPFLNNGEQDPSFPDRPPEHRMSGPYDEDRDSTSGYHPMETRRSSHRHSEGVGSGPIDRVDLARDESSADLSKKRLSQGAANPSDVRNLSDDQNSREKALQFGSDWKNSMLVESSEQTPIAAIIHNDGSPGRRFFCPVKTCEKATEGITRITNLYRHASTVHGLDEWVNEHKEVEERRRKETRAQNKRQKTTKPKGDNKRGAGTEINSLPSQRC